MQSQGLHFNKNYAVSIQPLLYEHIHHILALLHSPIHPLQSPFAFVPEKDMPASVPAQQRAAVITPVRGRTLPVQPKAS